MSSCELCGQTVSFVRDTPDGKYSACEVCWSEYPKMLKPVSYAWGIYEVSDIGPQEDGSVNVEHTTVGGKGRVGRLHEEHKIG